MAAKKTALAKYLTPKQCSGELRELCARLGTEEVALVRNLGHSYCPRAFYPLAPRNREKLPRIAAFAVDMDGTSTTTEPLALHALEYMMRCATGLTTKEEWEGFDAEKDHPFIIGNSNFFHTEFLFNRYKDNIRDESLKEAFLEALFWTLSNMEDRIRRDQIQANARHCGLGPLLEDPAFRDAIGHKLGEEKSASLAKDCKKSFGPLFVFNHHSERVSVAMDIYYYRYHSMLKKIEEGRGEELSKTLFGVGAVRLIAPMSGYGIFLALIKGWLGEEAGRLYDRLAAGLPSGMEKSGSAEKLSRLGLHFQRNPARIALVTASIAFEAHAVMKEVIRVVREEAGTWELAKERREEIQSNIADYRAVFDGFITASDSHEGRLKPHPDLYSLALYEMSISPEDYPFCIGVEDTEPGILSLRAAGFPTAVALPNRDTTGQNYEMACHVLHGGLPEMILNEDLFLSIPEK